MTTDTLTAQLQEEARDKIAKRCTQYGGSATSPTMLRTDDVLYELDTIIATAVQKAIKAYHAELEEKILQAYCTPEHHDTHVCGFNDGEQVCDCYNEALYMARKLSDSIINKE